MKNCKNRGITLVALIVTVIVMLILAGVVITLVIDEGGIINLAQQAGQNSINAQEQEQKDLEDLYSSMMVATNDDAKITISMEDLNSLIDSKIQERMNSLNTEIGQLVFTEADCTFFDGAIVESCTVRGYKIGNMIHVKYTVPISKLPSINNQNYLLFNLPESYVANESSRVIGLIETRSQPKGYVGGLVNASNKCFSAVPNLTTIPTTDGSTRIDGDFMYYIGD